MIEMDQVTGQLERLAASGDVPSRVKTASQALVARLRAPVRIGVMGFSGAGKLRVVKGLTGVDLTDVPGDLPTLELGFARAASTEAMLADGTMIRHGGALSADLLAQAPVFLRCRVPEAALEGRQVLLLTADAAELPAALAWAAERVDICLWCTAAWSDADRRVWRAAPEWLGHHAVLVETGGTPGSDGAEDGFEAAFAVQAAEGMAQLRAHLDATVAEAAAQDLLAAQMMLQRHGVVEAALEVAPEIPKDPEARADLARLFQTLRKGAETLRKDLAQDGIEALPGAVEEIIGSLSDRAGEMDQLAECWPEVPGMLLEARDLALLMQMEDGPEQPADAARLLGQVRRDMEALLAA